MTNLIIEKYESTFSDKLVKFLDSYSKQRVLIGKFDVDEFDRIKEYKLLCHNDFFYPRFENLDCQGLYIVLKNDEIICTLERYYDSVFDFYWDIPLGLIEGISTDKNNYMLNLYNCEFKDNSYWNNISQKSIKYPEYTYLFSDKLYTCDKNSNFIEKYENVRFRKIENLDSVKCHVYSEHAFFLENFVYEHPIFFHELWENANGFQLFSGFQGFSPYLLKQWIKSNKERSEFQLCVFVQDNVILCYDFAKMEDDKYYFSANSGYSIAIENEELKKSLDKIIYPPDIHANLSLRNKLENNKIVEGQNIIFH